MTKIYLVFFVLLVVVSLVVSRPAPDSAGVVPRPDGISYGGIPYGSISGQLSLYYGEYEPLLVADNKVTLNEVQLL